MNKAVFEKARLWPRRSASRQFELGAFPQELRLQTMLASGAGETAPFQSSAEGTLSTQESE